MRANRFRPGFDHLCARITPSDPGVTFVPVLPMPTIDGLMPGEDSQIPSDHYADPVDYDQSGTYLNPPMPVTYGQ